MAEESKIENSTTPASLVGRLVIRKGYPTKKSIRELFEKNDLLVNLDLYSALHKVVWSGRNTEERVNAVNKELNKAGFVTQAELPDAVRTGSITITRKV